MSSERSEPGFLPLMEAFHTIQGEGHFAGTSAYFIRLGGCDVGCHWCDVKASWDAAQFDWVSVEEIATNCLTSNPEIVVITGGEPLMYDLSELTTRLKQAGLPTHIETSGVYRLTGNWDWVCFSPKKFKSPSPAIYQEADELKVVVYNKSDLKWAESHANLSNEKTILSLQPEWSKAKEMMPLIVDYVKQNPKWRISLQTHKFLGIP